MAAAGSRDPARVDAEGSVALRTVERTLERRYAAHLEEVGRLVRAGVSVMRREGNFDPRVSQIVKEAGLSNQAFYRYFRSKDELLLAVLDDGVRELVSYLRHRMAGAASPTEGIRHWILGVLSQGLDPGAAEATRPFVMPQARLAERFPDEVARSIRQLTSPLADAISEGVATGELADRDPERDARAIYDLAMGWLQRTLVEEAAPSLDDANHVLEFAIAGLLRGRRGD